LPEARIMRIDRDTTRAKHAWPDMRAAIARGEVDVLVGTQLLSKGHDFPGLGLVCVLNADQSLYSTDFRAAEHLFAQLTQVAGRAGRGRIAGEVLIQTQFPSHPLYLAVQAHDYRGFAQALLAEREHARFPPFVFQAILRAEAVKLEQALAFLGKAASLCAEIAQGVDVFEPTAATMERLKGQERAQLLVQSSARSLLHAFLNRWTERLTQLRVPGARWAIDVDPMSV
jgi:primosomal protein N' (replication factor Y)